MNTTTNSIDTSKMLDAVQPALAYQAWVKPRIAAAFQTLRSQGCARSFVEK